MGPAHAPTRAALVIGFSKKNQSLESLCGDQAKRKPDDNEDEDFARLHTGPSKRLQRFYPG